MQFIAHTASTLSCFDASGSTRSIASKIAFNCCLPDDSLEARANEERHAADAGRVYSSGVWRDAGAQRRLVDALGPALAGGLHDDFEWYRCRGAFFHNDAHYDNRLFGVWCISGPPADLVFPRASLRIDITPGNIAVFDPFEVHGILLRDATHFSATDYEAVAATVLLGFELDLTAEIAAAFGIAAGINGPMISSRTRISAATGAFDSLN